MEKLSLFNSLQTMLIPEDNIIGYDINILKFNPSASTSVPGIDLCFFTCCRPLYVV